MTVSSGAAVTSTTGAKSTVMPSPRMAWPRCSAIWYTSSAVLVWASTRGEGWLPISDDNRWTRPPSSSTLTASANGPAAPAISGIEPSVSIDRSVQLPMKMPPTWLSVTTARASAAFCTPTIKSCASLSRSGIDWTSHAAGAGAAGTGFASGATDEAAEAETAGDVCAE